MAQRILSLSGGGVRGLITLQALKYLEESTRQPCAALFDVISGTSTGAILACGLARGCSAAELERFYLSLCPKIFKKRWLSLSGFAGPQYDAAPLEAELQRVLGPLHLDQTHTQLAVATYNIERRNNRLVTSWAPDGFTGQLWELARMSSAAPTFFPPYKSHIDGGLCANDPGLWTLVDWCRHQGIEPDACSLLSLGTGTCETSIRSADAASWGKTSWISPILSICMDGSQDLSHILAGELTRKFLRVDCALSEQQAEMDNVAPENLRALQDAGKLLTLKTKPQLDEFLK